MSRARDNGWRFALSQVRTSRTWDAASVLGLRAAVRGAAVHALVASAPSDHDGPTGRAGGRVGLVQVGRVLGGMLGGVGLQPRGAVHRPRGGGGPLLPR